MNIDRFGSMPVDSGSQVQRTQPAGAGPVVAQVRADPSNPPAVSNTHGYPQPNKVSVISLAFLPGTRAKIKAADNMAFKPATGVSVDDRMRAAQAVPVLQNQRLQENARARDMKAATKAQTAPKPLNADASRFQKAKHSAAARLQSAKSGAGKLFQATKRKVGETKQGFDRLSGNGRSTGTGSQALSVIHAMTDSIGLISNGKKAVGDIFDNKRCQELLNAGKKELANIEKQKKAPGADIKALEQREAVIKNGISCLEQRIQEKNPTFAAQKAVLSGIGLAHSATSLVAGLTSFVHLVMPAATSVPVVGQALSAVVLPLSAALAIDGLVASKSNLTQAKKDLKLVQGDLPQQIESRDRLAHFDNVLQLVPTDHPARGHLVIQNNNIKNAQKDLKKLDQQLLSGNLSKAQVATIKQQKNKANEALEQSRKQVLHFLQDPGLETAHKRAKLQNVMYNSASVMSTTVTPYFQQKLKTKAAGEYVRGAGECLGLASTGITAVGAISTAATGGAAAPVLVAGIGLGIASTATVYGGGFLVRKIRNMQLGKDRVRTESFDAALMAQMKSELAVWNDLPPHMRSQTTVASMFAIIQKHDPAIANSQDPEAAMKWAAGLVNEPPKGPKQKAFKESRERMIEHDNTRGIIGGITKRAVAAITPKVGGK